VGVIVVQNCSISHPGHYVNVAKRVWEWITVERRYDGYYWEEIVCKKNKNKSAGAGASAAGSIVNNGCATTNTDGIITSNGCAADDGSPPPKLLQAAFMNQFENIANVQSHYTTTGPEIYTQLNGKVDAFVMSAGTGGTLVGVGGYLKERWYNNEQEQHNNKQQSNNNQQRQCNHAPPRIVLVDPPGSSLYNKIKYGVAYAAQQSERKLRRHRYDTLAEGIGLDRITANFGLGCESIVWNGSDEYGGGGEGKSQSGEGGGGRKAVFGDKIASMLDSRNKGNGKEDQLSSSTNNSSSKHNNPNIYSNNHRQPPPYYSSKIIDDAISITDQQAVYMAHYLLRHEGLFVGSSTAMNLVGALKVAAQLSDSAREGCETGKKTTGGARNVVTVVCDGGQRHTGRFWNQDFIVKEWGLVWPDGDCKNENIDGDNSGGVGGDNNYDILKVLGIDVN